MYRIFATSNRSSVERTPDSPPVERKENPVPGPSCPAPPNFIFGTETHTYPYDLRENFCRRPAPPLVAYVHEGLSTGANIRNVPIRTASHRQAASASTSPPCRTNRQRPNAFRRTPYGFGGTLLYRYREAEKTSADPTETDYPRCPVSTRYSAICTAFSAAPLRIWSLTHQNVSPLGSEISSRMRPT